MRFPLIAAAAAAAALAAVPTSSVAQAATATASISVGVTVNGTCTLEAPALSFGSVSDVAVNRTTSGSIVIRCSSAATNLSVSVGQGQNYVNPNRRLRFGTNYLNYNLYKDAGCSQAFGSTTTETYTVSSIGAGGQVSVPIVACLFGSQTAGAAGQYVDSVDVTLTY